MSAKPSTVMVVVPDAAALQCLTGTLGFLALKKFDVHVAVQCDPPGAQSLAWYDKLYAGLTISVLPDLPRDRWRRLAALVRPALEPRRGSPPATRWSESRQRRFSAIERSIPVPPATIAALEAVRPDVLVVTRLRGPDAPHVDFIRAARALRIPTVHVTLGWEEVAHASLANECPDCVALWNASQRRDGVAAGVPMRRTAVIGAHLATDMIDDRAVAPRDEYCRALSVDPASPLVLLALPRWHGDEAVRWLRDWNAARMANPATRDAGVVVMTRAHGDDDVVRRLALPGVAAVIAVEGNPYAAAQQLHGALEHADAVVALDGAAALEAFARSRPVLAYARHANEDVARLCGRVRQDGGAPLVAGSIGEQLTQLAAVLQGDVDGAALLRARVFVRPHGNDVEPAFLLVTRLVREVTPNGRAPLPEAPHAAARWARVARFIGRHPGEGAPALDGKIRFLMALESGAALEHWSGLKDAVVDRGHRVTPVLMNDGSNQLRLSGLGRRLSALRLGLSLLDSSPAPEMVRWRRRLEAVDLPAWTSRLHVFAGRPALLSAARRMADVIDRHLPASRHASRLVRRARPGAVLALPSLEAATAVATWGAQADVLRAARAAGLPASAGLAGGTQSIDNALAAGALRPQGVNRTMADALAEDLERWISVPGAHERTGGAGVGLAIAACGALAAVVVAAFIAGASSAATRATSRTMLRVRGALGRGSR